MKLILQLVSCCVCWCTASEKRLHEQVRQGHCHPRKGAYNPASPVVPARLMAGHGAEGPRSGRGLSSARAPRMGESRGAGLDNRANYQTQATPENPSPHRSLPAGSEFQRCRGPAVREESRVPGESRSPVPGVQAGCPVPRARLPTSADPAQPEYPEPRRPAGPGEWSAHWVLPELRELRGQLVRQVPPGRRAPTGRPVPRELQARWVRAELPGRWVQPRPPGRWELVAHPVPTGRQERWGRPGLAEQTTRPERPER